MRTAAITLGFLLAASAAADAAWADHAGSYVVPGRSDVPVIINGIDASWGVVEGDWGLYRPGAVSPTVIPSLYAQPAGTRSRPFRHFFPSLGELPHVGRHEIEPPANRTLPPRAESFHRNWSSQSPNLPATEYAPTPPMIIAPSDGYRRHRPHH